MQRKPALTLDSLAQQLGSIATLSMTGWLRTDPPPGRFKRIPL